MSSRKVGDYGRNSRTVLATGTWFFAVVLMAFLYPAVTAFAQSGWEAWKPLNEFLDIRFKTLPLDFGKGKREIHWQVRSRYLYKVRVDYLVSFDTDDKFNKASETDTLNPGQVSSADGSWSIGRSVTGFNVLKVVSLDSGGSPISGKGEGRPGFSRPSLLGVQLEPGCVALLKAESEKLKLAGATKTLLAWTPLITLIGESNAIHEAVFIHNTDWDSLAESFEAVNKVVLYSLAQDARVHANSGEHFGNPNARGFWNAMADFYQSLAERTEVPTATSAKAISGQASLSDLTGMWVRDDGELVSITENGNMVAARKITGNQAVPAAEISWVGRYSSRSFPGRGQRGSKSTGQRSWVPVTIVVQDANTIRVLGFNPDRIYRRSSGQ